MFGYGEPKGPGLVEARSGLTCKSIVESELGAERRIEPSSSWFPPKNPSE